MADTKQDISNGSTQSRVVLAKPRLGGFGSSSFGASSSSKSNSPFGSVLRPAQLKPTSNPFIKVNDEVLESKAVDKSNENSNTEEKVKEEEETPKFMPLGTTNVTARAANPVPAPATGGSSFVFGQNLSDRVVMKENVNNGEASSEHSASNGTSGLLFTSAAATVKENNQEEASTSEAVSGSVSGEGLAAAAAEYERSHARPPPPTSNCTTTGEEGEINVLQISCRLFAWETGSWRERGRGVLRLNDSAGGAGGGPGSRLVARVAGSLRVVLNTKLWPEMVVERAGTKSLRVTAADAQQQIKLYLIMGAPGDIAQLYRALLSRIAVSKKPVACTQNATSQEAAERLDNDYDEKPLADDGNDSDEGNYEEKQDNATDEVELNKSNDRLDTENTDSSLEDNKEKSLKRKEPVDDETSPKRQCPKIVIQ